MSQLSTERAELLRATELQACDLENMPALTQVQCDMLDSIAESIRSCKRMVYHQLAQIAALMNTAKAAVDDANWRVWLHNIGFSYRSAMQYIQTMQRFGNMQDAVQDVKISNLFKLLSLHVGEEERFLAENDVANMTVRETEAAVKAYREEHEPKQQSIDVEAITAQAKREGAEEARQEYQADLVSMQKRVDEVNTLEYQAKDLFNSLQAERAKVADVQKELQDKDAMIDMLQEQLNNQSGASLEEQLQSIHSDPTGYEERPISAAFAYDVHAFIGQHASLPHQHGKISALPQSEKDAMREAIRKMRDHLDAVEWLIGMEAVT